jgi:O-antigen/teichoic acid export membrane protein
MTTAPNERSRPRWGSPLIWIAALQVLMTLVALGRAKALAILLSPAGFGVAATIDQLIMTVVQLGALGMPFASLKYMALAHSEGQAQFQRVAAGFAKAILGAGLLSTLILLLILQFRPDWIGRELAPYLSYLKLAALCVPAAMLAILAANTLAAAQRPVGAAVMNFAVAFALAVGAVIGVILDGLNGLYAGIAIAGLLSTIGAALFLFRDVGVRWVMGRRGEAGVAEALRHFPASAGFYLTMVLSAGSMFLIRYLVLAHLGEAPAGFFQSGMSIALTAGAILTPLINLYLIPILSRKAPTADKVAACERFMLGLLPVLILAIIPILCFPQTIIRILYTDQFTPAAYILFSFVLWQCLTQIAYICLQLLIGLDDLFSVPVLALIGFGGSALLAELLLPRMGLIGAPAAMALGMAIYAVAILARLKWKHGVSLTSQIHGRVAWMMTVTLAGGFLFMRGAEFSLPGFGARALFAIACLVLTWLLFLRNDTATLALVRRFTGRRA